MAWQFQICRIEWTPSGETVTCTDIGSSVFEYFPSSPPLGIVRTQGRQRGSTPITHTAPNVTETVRVKFAAASFWTGFRALETALERALLWAEGDRRDMRAVVRFCDSTRHGTTYYESPLIDGRITLERGPILSLTWERGPYWSGPEVPLPVVNNWVTYSGEVTPGVTGYYDYAQVTNADDGTPTRCNWVILTPPDGDVPTPVRLRIQNNYTTGRLKTVRVGWNDRPQSLVLEGEDSEDGPVITNGAQYSNMAVGADSGFRWKIEQTSIRDFSGPFQVWANGSLSGSTWRVASGYALTRKQYGTRAAVDGENGWTNLGSLSFPPGGYVHPARYPVTVWLDGSGTGSLDFLLFLPQRQHRWLSFSGYNCQPGACIEDDGWRKELVLEHDGQRLPIIEGFGEPLMAWPSGLLPGSARQMLTFALESDSTSAEADRSAIVQVFARPHYRTLP